jgi:hypothetical protein
MHMGVSKNDTLKQRFMRKVVKSSGCWRWKGQKNQAGRGQFSYRGRLYNAPRTSYRLFKGRVSRTLHVLHKCDNPNCVNPKHLFLGTQRDNARDMVIKGRQNDTRGESSGAAKLNNTTVLEIRRRHKRWCPKNGTEALAKEFNISTSVVRCIVGRRAWKHI